MYYEKSKNYRFYEKKILTDRVEFHFFVLINGVKWCYVQVVVSFLSSTFCHRFLRLEEILVHYVVRYYKYCTSKRAEQKREGIV